MAELAFLGGEPIRKDPLFPGYQTIGEEEKQAVAAVLDSGVLSRYLGTWHEDFLGGTQVRKFEEAWAEVHGARFGVAMNSATSGLYAAAAAAGLGPGDEMIVTPYTMTSSATAALVNNAVPVFADIDPETFNVTAETVRGKITERTKAIMVVHIFGLPADMDPIMELARERGLLVIEDCAQAPLTRYKGRHVGTFGHIGVFSLNYHKHIHTGEGSVVVTDDEGLCERLQLIRNHAEAVVEGKGTANLINMIGFNYRLGEIEAAIGLCQLDKAQGLIDRRRDNVAFLLKGFDGLDGLVPAKVPGDREHAYYLHPLTYRPDVTGVPRDLVVRALRAELPLTRLREQDGVLIGQGYVRPLHLQPLYQTLVGYGEVGCPFKCPHYAGTPNYAKGICPNVERAHETTLITHEFMRPPMSHADMSDAIDAFHKVWDNMKVLRRHEDAR